MLEFVNGAESLLASGTEYYQLEHEGVHGVGLRVAGLPHFGN